MQGREAALRAAKSSGRAEWRYTDRIYRSEALSGLPPDADSFVRALRRAEDDGDPGADIAMWAGGLGAVDKCVCGTPLIAENAFADALIKHYRLRGTKAEHKREKMISATNESEEGEIRLETRNQRKERDHQLQVGGKNDSAKEE